MRKLTLKPASNKRSLVDSLMTGYHQACMNQTMQMATRLRQTFTHADLTDPDMADLLKGALEDLRDFGNDLEAAMRDELEENLGLKQPDTEPIIIEGQVDAITHQDNELERPAAEIEQELGQPVPEQIVINGQVQVIDEVDQDNESNEQTVESE